MSGMDCNGQKMFMSFLEDGAHYHLCTCTGRVGRGMRDVGVGSAAAPRLQMPLLSCPLTPFVLYRHHTTRQLRQSVLIMLTVKTHTSTQFCCVSFKTAAAGPVERCGPLAAEGHAVRRRPVVLLAVVQLEALLAAPELAGAQRLCGSCIATAVEA